MNKLKYTNNSILDNRKFNFEELKQYKTGVVAKGNQPKYTNYDGSIFIKERFCYQDKLWNDNLVECLASSLCKQLDINAIDQGLCMIDKIDYNSLGTYSYNFLSKGDIFLTRYQLVKAQFRNSFDYKVAEKKYSRDANTRLSFDLKVLGNYVDKESLERYLLEMCLMDILILNEDRHYNNYGLIYNEITNEYRVPPLFDFGIGAFEHDLMYIDLPFGKCLNQCRLRNYLVRPRKLMKWLRSLDNLNINRKIEMMKDLVFEEEYIPNLKYKEYIRYIKDGLL